MTIPIQNKRYRVMLDRGFSHSRNQYIKVVWCRDSEMGVRTAIKNPGESEWQFADPDPFNPNKHSATAE